MATTWTFMGHWKNDRLVLDYHVDGDVEDDRDDDGTYDQGLFSASGSGDTPEAAWADIKSEYESDQG